MRRRPSHAIACAKARSSRLAARLVVAVAMTTALLTSGCAGDDTLGRPIDVNLGVWNRSQFELLEVKAHANAEPHPEGPNLLTEPLPPGTETVLPFTSTFHLTVVRKKVEVGEPIAFTTAVPVIAETDGFTLVVFDEAFRLLAPNDPR